MKKLLVVINEHTIGYINLDYSKTVYVLNDLITKGATFCLNRHDILLTPFDYIRMATEADFDTFRVCFNGYKQDKNFVWKQ